MLRNKFLILIPVAPTSAIFARFLLLYVLHSETQGRGTNVTTYNVLFCCVTSHGLADITVSVEPADSFFRAEE